MSTTQSSSTTPPLPITVHTAATKPLTYSWSSFDNKLEARLRFSHRPYTRAQGSPRSAPRGKVPYARIGPLDAKNAGPEKGVQDEDEDEDEGLGEVREKVEKEGVTMGDSTLITRTLIQMGELGDLNAGLNGVQKGMDLMVRALVEEKIYFIAVGVESIQSPVLFACLLWRDE